jgi:hypothetical protein
MDWRPRGFNWYIPFLIKFSKAAFFYGFDGQIWLLVLRRLIFLKGSRLIVDTESGQAASERGLLLFSQALFRPF